MTKEAEKKAKAKGKKKDTANSPKPRHRVNLLAMLEYLKENNWRIEEHWYKARKIPTGEAYPGENGEMVDVVAKATGTFFNDVSEILRNPDTKREWENFTKKFNLNQRARKTLADLKNSQDITRQVCKQGKTGYFIRVPYLDIWLGSNDQAQLLKTDLSITYTDNEIVITRAIT